MRLDHLLSERKVKAPVYGAVLELYSSFLSFPYLLNADFGTVAQLVRASL